MYWRYKSAIGYLYIVPLKDGRFGFVYDDVVWESSDTPQIEADNVACFCTGCFMWDILDCKVDYPSDLSEWELCHETH